MPHMPPLPPSPHLNSAEEALLFAIRAAPTPAQRGRLNELLAGSEEAWHRLWLEAERQHVQPLVARSVCDGCLAAAAPPVIRDAAKNTRMRVLLHNMSLQAELERIGELLHAHGLPVTPLKGTALTNRLYGSLDARWCGDIDLLVPDSSHEAALRILEEAGYSPEPAISPGSETHPFHGAPLARPGPGTVFVVELHWKLSDPRFTTINHEMLWSRILNKSDKARGLSPLPPEELLVFLALHLSKHHTGVLRLLADIDRLIEREGAALDWRYVIGLAKRWGVTPLLYFELSYAYLLLGTRIPTWVLPELTPAAWRRSLVNLLAGTQTILRPPASMSLRYDRFRLAHCAMLDPLRRSLGAYWTSLCPATDQRAQGGWRGAIVTARGPLLGVARTIVVITGAIAARTRLASPCAREGGVRWV